MRKNLMLVFTVLLAMICYFPAPLAATELQEAVLYTVRDDGTLEYNVVHESLLTDAQITDMTGNEIDTIDKLKEVLGTPDAPAKVFSTDTGDRTLGKAVIADITFDDNSDTITALTITEVRERPVIGITWKSDTIGDDYQGFAEAYERNGAYAVYLPQVTTAEDAIEILNQIDGIFFTGGEDWNPALYDEEQTPHGSSGWNDARDTSDLNLLQQAVELDVPMLAVCRGAQGFNIAMGGGLIQDVPYYLGQEVEAGRIDAGRVSRELEDSGYNKWDPDTQKSSWVTCSDSGNTHRRVQIDGLVHSGGTRYHALLGDGETSGISPDSKWLYEIIGDTELKLVATAHHQAVNPAKLGEGLTIVAYSSDGIVEAIEHQASTFALAIQWHPERDALADTRGVDVDQDECNALLRALVEYAGGYYDKKNTVARGGGGCNAAAVPWLLLMAVALPAFYHKKGCGKKIK